MLRALFVIGTRPEAIKLAPVVAECRRREQIEPLVCLTGQHRELVAPLIEHFELSVDVDLGLMEPGQTPARFTGRCLAELDASLARLAPGCLVAQGDTNTVVAAALAAFYRQVPFVHVEAGLRSGNLSSPWPEELNRTLAGLAARLHCAPTERAAKNLRASGVAAEAIRVTGNPVVDALLWTLERQRSHAPELSGELSSLPVGPMVLITAHRRESFGPPLKSICRGIGLLAARFPEVQFVWPVHPNPQVRGPVERLLHGRENVRLIEPLGYPQFVWLLQRALLILTDSGGIQEEAPSLGKHVLVLRETTERPEAVEAGVAELIGTSAARIVERASSLLLPLLRLPPGSRPSLAPLSAFNPYGDGQASRRIVDSLLACCSPAGRGSRAAWPARFCIFS